MTYDWMVRIQPVVLARYPLLLRLFGASLQWLRSLPRAFRRFVLCSPVVKIDQPSVLVE